MQERRAFIRNRTYIGGKVVFNRRLSTMDCLVRNLSADGAKLTFCETGIIPSEFDITINNKGDSRRARIIWRTREEAGIRFVCADRAPIVSIETARRIKELEAERDRLARRVAQLSEPA